MVAGEEEKELVVAGVPAARGIRVVKEEANALESAVDSAGVLESADALEPGTDVNWLYSLVPASWKEIMKPCESALQRLSLALSTKAFLPPREFLWSALELPLNQIRVVILGQDPYPTPGNAHGLAFSVLPDVAVPASLKNIYKELVTDIPGFVAPSHGHLKKWADQGVLLLNSVLTVEPGQPQSHSKLGWEAVTDHLLKEIAARRPETIFVLWGKSAQAKKGCLGECTVIESTHPSPLSAHRGFLGSRPFSAINRLLEERGETAVDWQI
jgi:uracil-DNA glycosylase